MPPNHFTEPTTAYWQQIVDARAVLRPDPPWQFGYPARLPDGRVLMLPIRPLASEPTHAVASLLLNQASLDVVETLGRMLAAQLAGLQADAVIGLPTLGLTLASGVARELSHTRYLPMGYSRKFWYDEALSTPVSSITSPTPGKRIYLDPHLLPLVAGKRVILVDDAVSTGTTLQAAWDLLESLGADVVACGVAMRQGRRWADRIGAQRTSRVFGVFDSPLLQAASEGWVLRA
jgi:adenine/guanine phosphoribosyltransferase-like PRPP-binding protein